MQTCTCLSWCHCHSLSVASVKFRLVLPFWYRLTRVVPEKGPLNRCVVCVCELGSRSHTVKNDYWYCQGEHWKTAYTVGVEAMSSGVQGQGFCLRIRRQGPLKPEYYITLHPFNGLFSQTALVSRYQKCKTSLDLNEARVLWGFEDGSGISWTICKQCAPCSWQITTPAPHHSIFTGRMLFLMPNQQCQSTKDSSLKARVLHI